MFTKIKKLGFAVAIAAMGFFTANAQTATQWKLDKTHSSVNFSINHFFSAVTGNFNLYDGKFNFDPNNLEGSYVEFTVDVASVDTKDARRDKHLQSSDFFDAKKYPKMTFKSTKFEKKSDNEFLVYGRLTIKNKVKNVVLPIKVKGQMEHPMKKGTLILGLELDTTLNRTEFGVGTGSWAATMVVGDEVKVHIPIELNRKK